MKENAEKNISNKDSISIFMVNDKREQVEGDFFIYIMDFSGKVLYMDGRYKTLSANSSGVEYANKLSDMLQGASLNEVVIVLNFKPKYKPSENIQRTFYLVPPKDLQLEREVKVLKEVKPVEGGYVIRLRSNSLLKSALLTTDTEGWFEKNYMDIVPNQDYNIFFKTNATLFEVVNSLKIKSLVNTFN